MNKLYLHRRALRGNIFAIIGVSLLLYFTFHALQGKRGFLRLITVQKEIAQLSSQNEKLSAERIYLEQQVSMMRPGSVDRDLLEERVRYTLGYKHGDEYSVLSH